MGKAEPRVSGNLDFFLLNGTEKTSSHTKKIRLDTYFMLYAKKNAPCIKVLNPKNKTI